MKNPIIKSPTFLDDLLEVSSTTGLTIAQRHKEREKEALAARKRVGLTGKPLSPEDYPEYYTLVEQVLVKKTFNCSHCGNSSSLITNLWDVMKRTFAKEDDSLREWK